MGSIEKLKALLEVDENGEEIAELISGLLAEESKRNVFIAKLEEIRNQLTSLHRELELSPAEEAVRNFVLEGKRPLTAQEVAEGVGDMFASLKHRTHASAALNSLVSKGVLGKFKTGYSFYFTAPREAVMERLKKRGEELASCSPVEIAKETGMPLGTVLNVIEELMIG